jgi:integrase
MAGRQAKIMSDGDVRRLVAYARRGSSPNRDVVVVLLSVKAGLRAMEIAQLTWNMITEGRARIGRQIELSDAVAKKGSGRRIPIHPDLKQALRELRRDTSDPTGPVVRSARGGAMRPNSIVNWFAAAFDDLGLDGCSSHSGRRTFITRAARSAHRAGGSLRDVQMLAGHRSIETTQRYIDGDTDAQRRLVRLI